MTKTQRFCISLGYLATKNNFIFSINQLAYLKMPRFRRRVNEPLMT